MDARDRMTNVGVFGVAAVVWFLVAVIVTTRDPIADRTAGYIGGLLIGVAFGLTSIPLFWLIVFGRHRRIAYRGDWLRAARRGGWVGLVVGLVVLLRVQGIFQWPFVLFVVALVVVAELTLSVER
jgi:hypothetical protein